MNPNELFSREARAGYRREVLDRAVVVQVGSGALGNNVTLNLALVGVGEVRQVDMDTVDPSNVSRSPGFRREWRGGGRERHKARELARYHHQISLAPDPVSRFYVGRIEELGFGAFEGAGAIVSAVDSFVVRAYLADVARLLGVPLIEAGFVAPRGQVSVFPNRDADAPCWRCLHPQITYGRFSCRDYAARVTAQGGIPATQPLAATIAGLVTEATVLALHGEFPLEDRVLFLDVRSGRSSLVEVSRDPECPGTHRRLDAPTELDLTVAATPRQVFDALSPAFAEPVLHLPTEFVLDAPCESCGRSVPVRRPTWALRTAPRCESCDPDVANTPAEEPSVPNVTMAIARSDALANRSLQRLGFRPRALLDVRDAATGAHCCVRLGGSLDQLYATLRRTEPVAPSNDDASFASVS